MDATTTRSLPWLLKKLRVDYPEFAYSESDATYFSASKQTIFYAPEADMATLLHEIAHGVLGHGHYDQDIELMSREREAWAYAAQTLAPRYKLIIDSETIEQSIDTYRQWLHVRSVCPNCETASPQTTNGTYACIACRCRWQASDAKTRRLRRTKLA